MTKGPGRGRGMLQLDTWKPCRRPGQPRDLTVKAVPIAELVKSSTQKQQPANEKPATSTAQNKPTTQDPPPLPASNTGNTPVKLVAKYSYKANPDRPGGFDEMSLTAGERLELISSHNVNPYWWEARKEETGEVAFVPATYVMVLESKLESLPWLEDMKEAKAKRRGETEKDDSEGPATFKPYVSAYAKNTTQPAKPVAKYSYYCEVCDKTLNGPKPYQAHMVSKAHKDEVEAASYNS